MPEILIKLEMVGARQKMSHKNLRAMVGVLRVPQNQRLTVGTL